MTFRALTGQQTKVLGFLRGYVTQKGFPPTLREIGEAIGLTNVTAVRGHISAPERKGYLIRSPDRARAIQLVEVPSLLSRVKHRLHEVFHTDDGVLHRVVYALAWATHRRMPLLVGPAKEYLSAFLGREAVEHGWRILDERIEPDHVVVVVETWPNHSPRLAVRRFQSGERGIREQLPAAPAMDRLWGLGYVATTDLDILDDLVEKMLQNQE